MNSWSCETFIYTLAQLDTIRQYLSANDQDVVKVFDALWNEGSFDGQNPAMVLRLIDRVRRENLK